MSWFSISRTTAILSTQISTCDLFDGCWGTIWIAGMSVSWMTSQNKVRGRLIDPSVVGRVGCFFSPNASGKLWLLTLNMFFLFNFNSFQLFSQIRAFQLPCIERCKVKAAVVPLQRENLRSGMRRRTAARHCTSRGSFILASNCQENMTQGMPRDPSFSGLGRQLIAAEDSATHSLCRTTMGPGRAVTQPCGSHSSEPLMYQGWALMKLHF